MSDFVPTIGYDDEDDGSYPLNHIAPSRPPHQSKRRKLSTWDAASTSSTSIFDELGAYTEDLENLQRYSSGNATTMDSDVESDRSLTPTLSVVSYTPDNQSEFLREADGRLFNVQNELYGLPADDAEFDRHDIQHAALCAATDGLYIPKELVQSVLADDGTEKSILDVGSGGGNWAIAAAREFPHCQVVGVDLAPVTSKELPPNCRFEFDDFTLGLPHYHNCFDLIHARSIGNGVKDFEGLVNELGRCLRPGGVILLTEGDFQLLGENLQPMDSYMYDGDEGPDKSWMMRLLFEAYNTMKERGSVLDGGMCLQKWLRASEFFENVDGQRVYTPIGAWATDPDPYIQGKLRWIGSKMKKNNKEFCYALKPMLVSEGYFPDSIDAIIAKAHEELDNLTVHMYIGWHYAWAQRPMDQGTLRSVTPDSDGDEEDWSREGSPRSDDISQVHTTSMARTTSTGNLADQSASSDSAEEYDSDVSDSEVSNSDCGPSRSPSPSPPSVHSAEPPS